MAKSLKQVLIDSYLYYRNNHLTIEQFASYNNIWVNDAEYLIAIGKDLHEEKISNVEVLTVPNCHYQINERSKYI